VRGKSEDSFFGFEKVVGVFFFAVFTNESRFLRDLNFEKNLSSFACENPK
jgi:hypothetical protein